ncbi:MAG: LPD38 domain-containing protein [Nitrospira sp.]
MEFVDSAGLLEEEDSGTVFIDSAGLLGDPEPKIGGKSAVQTVQGGIDAPKLPPRTAIPKEALDATKGIGDVSLKRQQADLQAKGKISHPAGLPETKAPTEYHPKGAAKETLSEIKKGPFALLKHLNPALEQIEKAVGLPKDIAEAPAPIGERLQEVGTKGIDQITKEQEADPDIMAFRDAVDRGVESYPTKVLAQLGPTAVAAGLSTIPVVGPGLATVFFLGINAEDTYQTAIDKGASPEKAQAISTAIAPIVSLLEMTGIGALTSKIPAARVFTRTLLDYAETSIVEGSTEVIQDVVIKLGAEWASKAEEETGDLFAERMSTQIPELFEGSWETFKIAAGIAGTVRSVGHAHSKLTKMSEKRRTKKFLGAIQALDEKAEKEELGDLAVKAMKGQRFDPEIDMTTGEDIKVETPQAPTEEPAPAPKPVVEPEQPLSPSQDIAQQILTGFDEKEQGIRSEAGRPLTEEEQAHKQNIIDNFDNPETLIPIIEEGYGFPDTEKNAAAEEREAKIAETEKEIARRREEMENPPEKKAQAEEAIKEARAEVEPNPTEAQIESGNYKKGHINIQGLDISIENAKGSTRNVDGKSFKMHHDYGYIKRTEGADGEQVDVYIGPELDAPFVFIVHQLDPATGKYDEDKVMLGFKTSIDAKEAYLKQYDDPGFFGARTPVRTDTFREALKAGTLSQLTREGIKKAKAKGKLTPKKKPRPGFDDPPTTAKVIKVFANKEDGTEIRVAKIDKGYSVTLKDVESGGVLPFSKIFPDEAGALAFAEETDRKARESNTNTEKFNALSKEIAGIEKQPAYKEETREGRILRSMAIDKRKEMKVLRPAAEVKSGQDIQAEKEARVKAKLTPKKKDEAPKKKAYVTPDIKRLAELRRKIHDFGSAREQGRGVKIVVHPADEDYFTVEIIDNGKRRGTGDTSLMAMDFAQDMALMELGAETKDVELLSARQAKEDKRAEAIKKLKEQLEGEGLDVIGGKVLQAGRGAKLSDKKVFGSKNTVFTKDKADAARERIRKRLNKLNVGVDPALLKDGIELGGYYIEGGARSFADFTEKMVADFGDAIKPYLKFIYQDVRDYPDAGFDPKGMDADSVVDGQAEAKSDTVKKKETEDDTGQPGKAGAKSLEGVSTEKVRKAGEGGKPGGDSVRGAGEDTRRASKPDKGRPATQPGVGTGEREVSHPTTRKKPVKNKSKSTGRDYRIRPDIDLLEEGGQKTKFKNNLSAIEILKHIESEGRLATPAEQAILVKYAGWGGMPQAFDSFNYQWKAEHKQLSEALTKEEYKSARASTPNAHYTSPKVIEGVYKALSRLGFKGGKILEPSVGTGHFFGMMPRAMAAKSRNTGIELDGITGRIAKQLYQSADIRVQGFEEAKIPDNFYDAAIGNVPFGDYKVHDTRYNDLKLNIHNYFFVKAMDKIRPGGVMAFITSSGTMNAKASKMRRLMSEKAKFVGAIRLPDSAFQKIAQTKVTTDIIFLRKLMPGEKPGGTKWLDSEMQEMTERVAAIGMKNELRNNEYFVAHPEMMLGRPTGDTLHPGRLALTDDGRDLSAALTEAIKKLPSNVVKKSEVKATTTKGLEETLPTPDFVKPGAYTVKDGKVYMDSKGRLVKPMTSTGRVIDGVGLKRVKGLIEIRAAIRQAFKSQVEDSSEATISQDRVKLNKVYDKFVKKFGFISSQPNGLVFRLDPDYYTLTALENWDKDTKLATKSDIFSKRTILPSIRATKADTAKEALLVSLSETNGIDFDRMSELYGKPEEEIQSELKGLIYENPEGGWESAEAYLSGNVKAKLAAAEGAAKFDKKYADNVEALKAVQPEDLLPSEIDVRLGASWVPTDDVRRFILGLVDVNTIVSYNSPMALWNVESPRGVGGYGQMAGGVLDRQKWGTERISAIGIIQKSLNAKIITIRDRTVDDKSVVNEKETLLAREKQEAIKAEFKKWLWEDGPRAIRLAADYNARFNTNRLRQHDGSHLNFHGMSPHIQLRPHQKNAVWRTLQEGNTLLAHVVGSGKTYTMIATAMELKRLGVIKKPMFGVPNHLIGEWAKSFKELYPASNILVPTKDDFKKANRKRLMGRIATGDWDAVLVAHSSFTRLPVSSGKVLEFLQIELDTLEQFITEETAASGRGSRIVKELEKAKRRLLVKMQAKQSAIAKRADHGITFEETGVDMLFIDEADLFKNLFFPTRMTRVTGLPNTESQRSFDLYVKTQLLNKMSKGKGVVFATGTPVSNSMAEVFTMQRYLQPDALEAQGLSHFDGWASNYGDTVSSMELAPDGSGFRMKTRFAKFTNVPELMTTFRTVMDLQTADMLKLPTPKLKGGKPTMVTAKPTEALIAYVKTLIKRGEDIQSGKVDPSEDNWLKITGDGRKAALDTRLVIPSTLESPGGKVNLAIGNIVEAWKRWESDKGTQLVFLDLSTPKGKGAQAKQQAQLVPETGKEDENDRAAETAEEGRLRGSVYDDIKRKLIRSGIPEAEIVFIHDANTDARKTKLFQDVNSGKVRILIGSTEKMGAGMNVQERLVALHHLDAPWRPRDLEQRDGRIMRQGNKLREANPDTFEVEIFRYATEAPSFDLYMWQTLEAKAKMIGQVMSGKSNMRSIDDIDDQSIRSIEEMKAITSGNPIIKEKTEIDIKVRKLNLLEASHRDSQYRLKRSLIQFKEEIERSKGVIEDLKKDIEFRDAHKQDKFSMVIDGTTFDDKAKAGDRIVEINESRRAAAKNPTWIDIGEYRGYAIELRTYFMSSGDINLASDFGNHNASVRDSGTGAITSIDAALKGMEKRVEQQEDHIKDREKQIADAKKEIGQDFEKADEIKKLSARSKEIETILSEPPKKAHEGREEDSGTASSIESDKPRAPNPNHDKIGPKRGGIPVDRAKIIDDLATMLDLTVRFGGFKYKVKGGRRLGVFKIKPEVIRTKFARDVGTTAHEAGHFLEKKLFGTNKSGNKLTGKAFTAFSEELDPIASQHNKAGSKTVEGFAEFVRFYVTDGAHAKKVAPKFYKWWEDFLSAQHPDIKQILLRARGQYDLYKAQDGPAKIDLLINRAPGKERLTARSHWDNFYFRNIDRLHPIAQFTKVMREAGAKPLADKDPEILARTFSGNVRKADWFVRHGPSDFNTFKKVGPGFEEIVQPIRGQWHEFWNYATAKRVVTDLKAKWGEGQIAEKTGGEFSWWQETHDKYQSKEWDDVLDKVYAFKNQVFHYLADSYGLTVDQRIQVLGPNPHHVPMYRVMDEPGSISSSAMKGGGKSFGNLKNPIKRFQGSTRQLIAPEESIIKDVFELVNLADRNAVARAVVDLAKSTPGAGRFVERVTKKIRPTKFRLEEIQKVLEQAGVDLDDIDLDLTASIFRAQNFPVPENHISVWEDGGVEIYRLHPDLFKAMQGMDSNAVRGWLMKFLGTFKQTLRLGATLTPEFAIGRNPFRDQWTTAINTGLGIKTPYFTAKGLFHVLAADKYYDAWVRSGGGQAGMINLSRIEIIKRNAKMVKDHNIAKTIVGHPWQALRLLVQAGEEMTRLGTFEAFTGDLEGSTKADRIAAAQESREGGIDFQRGGYGATVQAFHEMTAFWRANIQGIDKLRRVSINNPARFAIQVGLGITLTSVLLVLRNMQDARWEEIPPWQKDISWIWLQGPIISKAQWAKLSVEEKRDLYQNTISRFPKPFELGVIFGSIPERILEWINGQNPEIGKSLLKTIGAAGISALLPVPTFLAPLIENYANYSGFTGRPIVPRSLEKLDPRFQSKAYTSEVAKKIGDLINKSPAKIDNMIRGWTGGLGLMATDAIDGIIKNQGVVELPPVPQETLADIPLIRAFVVRFPNTSAQSINTFYEKYKDAQRSSSSYIALLRQEKDEEAEKYYEKHEQEINNSKPMRDISKALGAYSQSIRGIYDDPKMSPEDKRDAIDLVYVEMIDLAKEALEELYPVEAK